MGPFLLEAFWQKAGMAVLCGFQEALAITLTAAFVLIGVQRLERLFPQLRRGVHSHELDGRVVSDGQ